MATWDEHPYYYTGHLFVLKPAAVFKAQVNMATITYPFQRLTYDNVTLGSYTAIKEGMTVLLGTTPGGDDLGRGRARLSESGVATATDVYVGQFSRGKLDGEFDVADNAYITVLNDYRVWSLVPRIASDGTVYKDYKAPYSWCEPQPPVANAGVAYAGFVDDVTGVITVNFDGSTSFAVASGASITSYAWDFVDGTPVSATTAQVTGVTFPPGFRWVRLTVTDSNSKSHTAVVPVLAINAASPESGYIENFSVVMEHLTREGHEIVFSIYDDLLTSDFPEGTLVLYWEDEYYNGVQASLVGPTGREHMKFIGWLADEPVQIMANERDTERVVQLHCVDVAYRLKELPGFPLALERANSPTTWLQLKGLNIDRYVWFILRWHSTVLSLADFTWSGTGDTYGVIALGSDGQSLWEQADGRTQAIAHLLTCDRWGRLAMRPDPQLQDSGSRTAEVQVALDGDDFVSLSYTRQRFPRIHWLWGDAIKASTSQASDADVTPLFCTAPGKAPGQGVSEANQSEQVVASQTELNAREGHRYAVRHNPTDTYFEVVLAHAGDGGIDPARMTWVTLTLSADIAAQRGLTFTNERFLPIEVTVEHDHVAGTKRVTLVCERERVGTPAATYIPPTGDFEQWEDLYPGDYGTGDGFDFGDMWLHNTNGMIAAFLQNSYVCRTGNFWDDPPTWDAVFLNFAGEPLLFIVDAFSPGYTAGTGAINGWVLTTQAVYRVTDIFNVIAPTLTLCYSFGYTLSLAGEDLTLMVGGDASFGVQGHVVFVIPRNANCYGPCDALFSTDGVNFTKVQLPGSTSASMTLPRPGVYVSSKTPGLVYVVTNADSTGREARFLISTNYGATWQISTWDGARHPKPTNLFEQGSCGLHVPYNNNDNERDLIYVKHPDLIYYRRKNGVEVDITPSGFNRVCRTRWGFVSAPGDRSKLAFVPMQTWNGRLFLSDDEGDSWTEQVEVQGHTAQVAISGDTDYAVYTWGHSWDIALGFSPEIFAKSTWNGVWYDKIGNMRTLVTSGTRSIIGICGGPAA